MSLLCRIEQAPSSPRALVELQTAAIQETQLIDTVSVLPCQVPTVQKIFF